MPSPSPGKFRGPVVRQLSLQNPTPLHSPSSRELKKQLSEDDMRVLESVEVTGQGWNPQAGAGTGVGGGKTIQAKMPGSRPKPVKVAWSDRKPGSLDTPAVEVIATKCQGQPRPTSLRTQRIRSPLLGNKDTLVYTRLQLAERLRNAWSEREKIKPNINIFLARTPESTRNENDPPPYPDTASAISDPSAPVDKKRKSMKVQAFSQEFPQQDFMVPEPPSLTGSEISPRSDGKVYSGHLQELNKIEIRLTKMERESEGRENKSLEEPSGGLKRCRKKTSEPEVAETPPVSAQDRRANFRRSSILQKTITESFSSGIDENENKNAAKIPQKKPPLMRAFSAPSQSEQSDPKAANLQKKVRIVPQKRLQPTVSFDLPGPNTDETAALRERIKSAPVRRKLKSAAARRKNKEKDSSDEEKETKDTATSTKKPSKRSQQKKVGEIVTMVSLVSPAASDTEDSVINLPMESWRGDENQEDTQTVKPSGEELKESTFVVQKFVSLRKATKSVTFQPHPVLNRSYSASFPLRRAPAGTPIIVPTPIISNPALTPAQLMERDKRSTVLSGSDERGIKRKLLRSSTESAKEEETLDVDENDSKDLTTAIGAKNKEEDEKESEKHNGEPEFKCKKERECWALYQKMVEKGVSVSFDTVLRGMLTPTEYRLRKNQLLSNC